MGELLRIISLFHWILIAIAVMVSLQIISENRNPYRTLAWVFALMAFPLIALIGYLIAGRSLSWRKMRRPHTSPEFHYSRELLSSSTLQRNHLAADPRLARLMNRKNQSPFTWKNSVKVLRNGEQKFPALFKAIEQACHHIHLEYYTLAPGKLGDLLRDLLIEKAKSGVQVRLLYDAVGSKKLTAEYLDSLLEAGVEIGAFLPVRFPYPSSKINYHDHRKMVIVDGKIGFIGGLNIADEYLTGKPLFSSWRDTHLMIEGEAVYLLQELFLSDWGFVTGLDVMAPSYFPVWRGQKECCVQITPNAPAQRWRYIYYSFFEFIMLANRSVYITTPYFIPEETLVMALESAALAGIDVRILVPHIPDRKWVQWAGRSYYLRLLRAGVKIYEFQAGFLHAKILLVDGQIASVGTANLDIRSMEINFEVNAMIYDEAICGELTEQFFDDLDQSIEITYEGWKSRSASSRMVESMARLLSPLL